MMKKQIVVISGLIFTLSSIAFAQTKTVTNADLEKFRQKRLQAEREYRENYERLGFPSPEELEQKRIADEKELIEYSQQLETQRLEREAIQAETEIEVLRLQTQYLQSQRNNSDYDSGAYYTGGYYPYYGGYYNYGRPFRRSKFNSTYRSGFSNAYPWMIIPQFRNQRKINPRFFPGNRNPRITIRTGRGRN